MIQECDKLIFKKEYHFSDSSIIEKGSVWLVNYLDEDNKTCRLLESVNPDQGWIGFHYETDAPGKYSKYYTNNLWNYVETKTQRAKRIINEH